MPIIDMHAHVTPESYKRAMAEGRTWHGLRGMPSILGHGSVVEPISDRIKEMDATGVDIEVLSPSPYFYQYGLESEATKVVAAECNNGIAEIVAANPTRFLGMGTVPMQDVGAAIVEMARVVQDLGFTGVMINDHVNGRTYDEQEFLPFFRAAEELGAILHFHQGGETVVGQRIKRYMLGNAVGNLAERALVFAALVFGGVLDRCPELKPFLAHGGGYTAFGVPRMDKVAGRFEGEFEATGALTPPFGAKLDDLYVLTRPPSDYLGRFLYDCCTYSGPALRYLIDRVGIDRVVLGTDYPAPMYLIDPVNWIRGLPDLSEEEKSSILSVNSTTILGL